VDGCPLNAQPACQTMGGKDEEMKEAKTDIQVIQSAGKLLDDALEHYITTCALFVTDDPCEIAFNLSDRWGPIEVGSMRCNITKWVGDKRKRMFGKI
jgi:hypothetical protein